VESAVAGGTFELPGKLRVHALAKLLGASSRDIIAVLDKLGQPVRSAQANISREVALEVVRNLRPGRLSGAASQPSPSQRPPEPRSETVQADPAQAEQVPTDSEERLSESALAPVFAAPQAMFLAPETSPPARPAAQQQPAPAAEPAPQEQQPRQEQQARQEEPANEADDESGGEEQGSRRRRRRGRRGRGRGRGGDNGEQAEATTDSETVREDQSAEAAEQTDTDGETETEETGSDAGSRRRRRRRRRKGAGDDDSASSREDDPPNTVVHVRDAAAEAEDEVRAVKGSTRLEAKRQRRRDGREAGRRRAPVLSEAEFLARRESVVRKMVIREYGDQTQIAVLEDNILVENFVTSVGSGSLVGNVYLGRVQNVLPSMEAAFVDIGRGRNAVLYAGEVDWDAAGLAGKARRIEQALSTGDSVLVQVTKEPVGHKGARLTTQVSLPGRFLVYVPGGGATGISRKLPDTERKRLKEILKRIVPDNAGVIIRTASEGTSEDALDRDVRRLQAQWEVIKDKAESTGTQAPQLLYEEPDLLIKVVRDLFTEDFSELTIQGDNAWDTIEAYVQHVAPDLAGRLRKHVGKNDVFTEYRVTEQIAKALDRKVWLPSGGYLVIDRTEAMTVIDVNTGKFTGSGGNLEETVTRNNLEAAEEIVRQLRLRDVGGIIVIDFIDMVLESNRDLVLRRLTECLGRDRTRHQVAEVTSLGLVQMTRKRVGTGLLEAYSSSCEHCRGRGLVVSMESAPPPASASSGSNGTTRRGKHRGKSAEPEPRSAAETGQIETEVAEETTPAAPEPAAETAPVAQLAEAQAATAEHGVAEVPPATAPSPPSPPSPSAPAAAAPPEPAPRAAETAVEQPAAQPRGEAEEAPSNGRVRRRVRRPTSSAGSAPTPVVVAQPTEDSAERRQPEATPEVPPPAAATATRRARRRRTASRPAGPPADTPAEIDAGIPADR
jgi:ribonuclease E